MTQSSLPGPAGGEPDVSYPAGFWPAWKRVTWYRLMRHLRKSRDKRFPIPLTLASGCRGQEASDRIRQLLERPEPCLISRFGNNELGTVLNYLSIRRPGRLDQRVLRYLRGESAPWWWDDRTAREMKKGAGFFPATPENLDRFARMALRDCAEIDVLGSWLAGEDQVADWFRGLSVPLDDLQPYVHADPWSETLQGRKVLVVHPFETSIRSQYARRTQLFRDPRVLPEFELLTLRAVQSVGGDCARFQDWFEALEWMQREIAAMDFDVAIIGAGAYGMALGAFIKRDLGRKAIHLGGAAQLLFGIRGRRWDEAPEYAHLFNDAWVRPTPEETPRTANRVEGGCYW